MHFVVCERALLLALCLVAPLVVEGPCDIYASGGTPCVAAHSTTRALFSAYSGILYQIKRGSDSHTLAFSTKLNAAPTATTNIGPLSAGGVANAAVQDSFCASTTCLTTTIFDQSGRGNHLTQAPPGGAARGTDPNGFDNLAAADGAPVMLNGQKVHWRQRARHADANPLVYGVFISPGTGYRNDATNGIAMGDAAEGMYAILDGTHFNGNCCFDYGNTETSSDDTGNGHMEAIYFDTAAVVGAGSGPWVLADLENGLFSGPNRTVNPSNPTITSRFVTLREPGTWTIRGGNAASDSLSTFWSGARPSDGYNPMDKEGTHVMWKSCAETSNTQDEVLMSLGTYTDIDGLTPASTESA
ncbi:alpha-L-arabinofuranosidase [Mycena leptocephala]|nr:alpha-L-arabinofuranosidase [Mycena leptocephala]